MTPADPINFYSDTREPSRTISACLPFNPEFHPERNGAVIIMLQAPDHGDSLCFTIKDIRSFAADLLKLCDEASKTPTP